MLENQYSYSENNWKSEYPIDTTMFYFRNAPITYRRILAMSSGTRRDVPQGALFKIDYQKSH